MTLTPQVEQYSLFHTDSGLFRAARAYRSLRHVMPDRVRETPPHSGGFPWTERHLQCLWADSRLRPRQLESSGGETIEILDPGSWNHEAGPDFLAATLKIGPSQRYLQGDVEIHVRPSGWRSHGHHRDPAYRGVVLHVTWFQGEAAPSLLPRTCLQVHLRTEMEKQPGFSFDAIDLAAYPYAVPNVQPACRILASWTLEKKQGLLDAAGAERLLRKRERMAWAMDSRSAEQVLYEETLAALGYRRNSAACRTLAQALPLEELRGRSENRETTACALLLGAAGLLPPELPSTHDPETCTHHRELWDAWWKHAGDLDRRMLKTSAWTRNGSRPANSPERRLAAAAWLFTGARIDKALPAAARQGLPALRRRLGQGSAGYFTRHYVLGGQPLQRPVSLLGDERICALACNVFAPWLEAAGHPDAAARIYRSQATGREENSLLREAAFRLFGPDHAPVIYGTALRRQGLLQVFFDFLVDRRPERLQALCRLLEQWS